MRTLVGIHVHSDPAGLRATLAQLARLTPSAPSWHSARLKGSAGPPASADATAAGQPAPSFDIVLLPDAPDAAVRNFLGDTPGLPPTLTGATPGAAAAFNRLARHDEADLVVFLEAGALPGPGWLACLQAALTADPTHGLAGPSTNRSWNMQALFAGARENELARHAALAKSRYGDAWRPTGPLHCLADFCYAVKRRVIDAIGAADEAYGQGPCWEMDYSVRAARAGFRAVWAQAAYVFRRPPTAARQRDEQRHFDASRQRYQDKFCGLRLDGTRAVHAPHCRGDDCVHFAPPGQVAIRLAWAPAEDRRAADVNAEISATAPAIAGVNVDASPAGSANAIANAIANATANATAHAMAVANPSADATTSAAALPLVSCIMPTRDRLPWMLQSISYFLRQDHARRELVIIDDGPTDHASKLPNDPRIRYRHQPHRQSIGAKRNQACELAAGDIIMQWDDDDWYSPGRISAQAAALIDGSADITALAAPCFFELGRWEFWTCTPALHRRLFVLDVHGGTLAYKRSVHGRLARYPDSSLGEDAVFLKAAVGKGARLARLEARDLFLYVRHGGNAWAFQCGRHLEPAGWRRTDEPVALAADRAFYARLSNRGVQADALAQSPSTVAPAPRLVTVQGVNLPAPESTPALVTCIMPTFNRRAFVPQAIAYFLRQDYPHCELVIVDDGDDSVCDLVPDLPSIRHVRLARRTRLGSKRNLAIEAGRGDIILHWDDDDWMDPRRISHQVAALQGGSADISGTSGVRFYEVARDRFTMYRHPPGGKRWLYGATLCYRRSLWQRKPFQPIDLGEDTAFVWAQPQGRLLDLRELPVFAAVVHSRNSSSPRPLSGPHWSAWNGANAAEVLGADWHFYRALRETVVPAAVHRHVG